MAADLAFVGGSVFEGLGRPARRLAVAVKDGRIAARGRPTTRSAELVDSSTEVHQLGDRLLTPGFVDAHVHPVYAGHAMLMCELHGVVEADECIAVVADVCRGRTRTSSGSPVVAGRWRGSPAARPTRQLLDAVVPDRPVYLPNRDGHGGWVNTRALEIAGIDAHTPDPADGRIEREPDGTPSGTLHEGAMALVGRHVPPPTQDDYDKAFEVAQEYLLLAGHHRVAGRDPG